MRTLWVKKIYNNKLVNTYSKYYQIEWEFNAIVLRIRDQLYLIFETLRLQEIKIKHINTRSTDVYLKTLNSFGPIMIC